MAQILSGAGLVFAYGMNGIQQVASTISSDTTGLLLIPIGIALSTLAISLFKRLAHIFG